MSQEDCKFTKAAAFDAQNCASAAGSSTSGKSIKNDDFVDIRGLDYNQFGQTTSKSMHIDFEQGFTNPEKQVALNISQKLSQKSYQQDDYTRSFSLDGSQRAKKCPLWAAIIFINLYCMCYIVFSSCIKELTAVFPVSIAEILFVRGFISIIFYGLITRVYGQNISSRTSRRNLKWLLLRAICPVIVLASAVIALQHIPIFIYSVLFQTLPFWSSIFGYFLVGESISSAEVIGIVICFSTIVTLATTQSDSGETSSASGESSANSSHYALGIMFALLVAAGSSANGAFARKMKTVHFSVQLFFLGLVGALVGMVGLTGQFIASGTAFPNSGSTYVKLSAACSIEVIGLIFMTLGYQNGNLSLMSLCANSSIIYGFMADVLVFNQQLSAIEGLGAFVIVTTIIVVGTIKLQQEQQS